MCSDKTQCRTQDLDYFYKIAKLYLKTIHKNIGGKNENLAERSPAEVRQDDEADRRRGRYFRVLLLSDRDWCEKRICSGCQKIAEVLELPWEKFFEEEK